jgi:spore maturation protein A
MVLFLAINNSSVTIIPFTLIGYRALKGSANPAEPLAGILIVTTFSTLFAVFLTRWMARRRGYQISADERGTRPEADAAKKGPE